MPPAKRSTPRNTANNSMLSIDKLKEQIRRVLFSLNEQAAEEVLKWRAKQAKKAATWATEGIDAWRNYAAKILVALDENDMETLIRLEYPKPPLPYIPEDEDEWIEQQRNPVNGWRNSFAYIAELEKLETYLGMIEGEYVGSSDLRAAGFDSTLHRLLS